MERLCLSKKMWLSAALLLTLLGVFILDHYGHQLPQEYNCLPTTHTTSSQQGATKLCWTFLTSWLMVTLQNGESYSIQC